MRERRGRGDGAGPELSFAAWRDLTGREPVFSDEGWFTHFFMGDRERLLSLPTHVLNARLAAADTAYRAIYTERLEAKAQRAADRSTKGGSDAS